MSPDAVSSIRTRATDQVARRGLAARKSRPQRGRVGEAKERMAVLGPGCAGLRVRGFV